MHVAGNIKDSRLSEGAAVDFINNSIITYIDLLEYLISFIVSLAIGVDIMTWTMNLSAVVIVSTSIIGFFLHNPLLQSPLLLVHFLSGNFCDKRHIS